MNKYNVRFTSIFNIMLNHHLEYYYWYSPLYTGKVMYEINEMIRVLEKFPYVAPMLSNDNDVRKYNIKNRFSIIYKIENNEVGLLYFLDNRMLNNSYMVKEEIEQYQL